MTGPPNKQAVELNRTSLYWDFYYFCFSSTILQVISSININIIEFFMANTGRFYYGL
jgi:hypothetical protein